MFFTNLYPAVIFRSTGVSGSMIKTNSNGDRESPWKIPLLVSTCPRSVPRSVIIIIIIIIYYYIYKLLRNYEASRMSHLRDFSRFVGLFQDEKS